MSQQAAKGAPKGVAKGEPPKAAKGEPKTAAKSAPSKVVALSWISLVARVVIGGAIMYAGLLKIGNLQQSVVAVRAYKLPLPDGLIQVIGYLMPIAEIVLGVAIITGLFTRWVVLLGAIMMLVYIVLIASAWARGLSIDCGCFTPGGLLLPDQKTKYLEDILRDIGLLVCGLFVFLFPSSPISVDKWIAKGDPEEA